MMKDLYIYAVATGISPSYFLDDMEWWEIELMQEAYYLKSRESWYQTRTVAMINAKVAGAKVPKDFLKFPWENEEEEEEEVDKDELEALRQRVKELNKKNNGEHISNEAPA